jgi:copper resistance protein B
MSRVVHILGTLALVAGTLLARPSDATAQDRQLFTFFELEQLEYRTGAGADTFTWDAQGWVGGDFNKLWAKTEGEHEVGGDLERAELQLLYSRAISANWDFQAGARVDVRPEPERGFAAFGFKGLAPYFFEVDAAAFVSHKGEVSARLEAEYDVLLTQRLIAKPSLEMNFAAQEVAARGIGSGLNDVELGLRVRYEIVREVAPYVGVAWERKVGATADLARRAGKDVDALKFVVGLRVWF